MPRRRWGLARGTPFAAVSSNVRAAPDSQQHGPGLVVSMGRGLRTSEPDKRQGMEQGRNT